MKKPVFKIGDGVVVGPWDGLVLSIHIRPGGVSYSVGYWGMDNAYSVGDFYDFEMKAPQEERIGFKG